MEGAGPLSAQGARRLGPAGQRRRMRGGRRIDPDFEPLLAEPPRESAQSAGSAEHYDSLQPRRVSDVESSPRHYDQVDREQDEALPLLSASSLRTKTGRTSRVGSAEAEIFHRPDLKAAPVSRSSSRRRHISRSRNVRRDTSGSGPVQNSNPATDLTSFMSYGCCCVQCIRTNEIGVLQTFGKFRKVIEPGLVLLPWPCTRVDRLSLRVQQLEVSCETKTRDNVFVTMGVTVQFQVIKELAYDAFYRLSNIQTQIQAYIFDVIRSTVPRIELDELFVSRSDVALDVVRSLQGTMHYFGYAIIDTLITDISPNSLVREAMNEINAARKLKEAMSHKAEAEKVVKVKAAEALAETLHLDGVGVAKQRNEIANGLQASIREFPDDTISSKNVMDLLLVSHYYDVLDAIGSENMFLYHNPKELRVLQEQVSSYFAPESDNREEDTGGIPDLLW